MFFATFLIASAVCSGVICFNDVILVPAEVEGFFSVFDIKLDSNLCYKRNTLVGCTDTATKTAAGSVARVSKSKKSAQTKMVN